MPRMRTVVVALGGSVAAASLVFTLHRPAAASSAAAAAPAAPPKVAVGEVVARSVVDELELTGTLAAVENVELRPRVSGHLDAVALPEGGRVKRGQLLFQLDQRPFAAVVDRARAELAVAREQLALARLRLARSETLVAEQTIPQSEHEATASQGSESQARVAAALAALQSAELELEHTRVRSPIDGRAGAALVTKGNLVSGGSANATQLTTITSIDPLYVQFDLDEPTYLRIVKRMGVGRAERVPPLPLRVTVGDGEGSARPATLHFVDSRLDPQTGTARARASIANSDGALRPGLFVHARLAVDGAREALLIADPAIGTDQQGRFVLVVGKNDIVEKRAVQLGGTVDGLRVVKSGLKASDRVVLRGLVRPGMTVAPQLAAMADAGPRAAKTTLTSGGRP